MAENRGQAIPLGHTRRKNHAMILREWRARASPSNADAYPRHFREKVVPELRKVPGFVGAHLSRRDLGDQLNFSSSQDGNPWTLFADLQEPTPTKRWWSRVPLRRW